MWPFWLILSGSVLVSNSIWNFNIKSLINWFLILLFLWHYLGEGSAVWSSPSDISVQSEAWAQSGGFRIPVECVLDSQFRPSPWSASLLMWSSLSISWMRPFRLTSWTTVMLIFLFLVSSTSSQLLPVIMPTLIVPKRRWWTGEREGREWEGRE